MKRRILVDLNVVLDVLLERAPHVEASAALWAAVERGELEGLLPAHCVTTLHDLATRSRSGGEISRTPFAPRRHGHPAVRSSRRGTRAGSRTRPARRSLCWRPWRSSTGTSTPDDGGGDRPTARVHAPGTAGHGGQGIGAGSSTATRPTRMGPCDSGSGRARPGCQCRGCPA